MHLPQTWSCKHVLTQLEMCDRTIPSALLIEDGQIIQNRNQQARRERLPLGGSVRKRARMVMEIVWGPCVLVLKGDQQGPSLIGEAQYEEVPYGLPIQWESLCPCCFLKMNDFFSKN